MSGVDSNIEAFNPISGRRYPSWDALVAAESEGWVVVITSTRPNTNPVVYGPFADKALATKSRARLRARYVVSERQEHGAKFKIASRIVLLWKDMA